MKTSIQILLIAITFVSAFTSCKKDDDTSENNAYVEDVADEIAASLCTSNGGVTDEMNSTISLSSEAEATTLKSASSDTLFSSDSTFVRENSNGSYYSYNYDFSTNYGIIMDDVSVYSFFYNSSIDGGFESIRISSSETRESNWEISGFEDSASKYTLNGSIIRSGQASSKVRNYSSMNSSSAITLNNLLFNKNTLELLSGSLTWKISGTVNNTSFNYTATIVYNGDGTAQLTINKNVYTVDLESGEIE